MRTKSTQRKKSDIRKFTSRLRTVQFRCGLILVLFFLASSALFCLSSTPKRYNLKVGAISHTTITATKDVVDVVATEEKQKAAAAAVEPTYRLEDGAAENVMASLQSVFNELRTVQAYGLTLRTATDTDKTVEGKVFTDDEISYAQKLVTSFSLSRYQATTLLRTSTESFDTMVSSVTLAVENALNTTIREGQLNQSIGSIMNVVGYKVDVSLHQNILPSVLSVVIKPNMVVETEATEQAREKAMESVEPVVYLQGQNIVREGERVSQNQIAMLDTLGLLQNKNIDFSMYLGMVLLVMAAVILLTLMLNLMRPEILRNLRQLSVAVLVIFLTEALSVLVMKLFNVFLLPILVCPMLLTVLLGPKVSIAGTLAISILVPGLAAASSSSGYSLEMVYLVISSCISGVLAVKLLRNKPQRMRVLLVGLVDGAANAVVFMALSLMTSANFMANLDMLGYVFLSGIISGLLAVAIQPVFEAAFNLATPSKLMELSNPTHPLMRRLLMEAPGTYHHSIIVANLSEAGAEKIGANPYLARAGAYYHDIGKLKRPSYFKENQIGDNPHDNTDPYVSAAIVTSHTRDGVNLAQKYHLPLEIQRIILEHHGDTPVMFFYNKALQQANGKEVNISDFRYDGMKPTTKESAIIMMADTVEAAVRSMHDPTPDSIAAFIDKLVKGKINDGQLNDAPLTLSDINNVCIAFSTVLNGVFHERIEYPNAKIPERKRDAEGNLVDEKKE